jgi:hypothetical protein
MREIELAMSPGSITLTISNGALVGRDVQIAECWIVLREAAGGCRCSGQHLEQLRCIAALQGEILNIFGRQYRGALAIFFRDNLRSRLYFHRLSSAAYRQTERRRGKVVTCV